MNISFEPLKESHFSLMLKWLETPHVKKWWDQDIVYTLDLVKEKYEPYVKGHKRVDGVNNPIHAYIINAEQVHIGYIQIYNAYDFPRSIPLPDLPKSLGAFDIFIGEEKYLGKNLGSKAISKFLSLYGTCYSHIFVDTDSNNIAAIKAYEKAGFKKLAEQKGAGEVWMLKQMKKNINPKIGLGILIFNTQEQILLGKRKNSHGASSWGPPGGHLEFGESFEECAIREVLEETGLIIDKPTFLAITNDVFKDEDKHYVSIFMKANLTNNQTVQNLEPHKVEEWHWFSLKSLPEHLFLPLQQLSSGFAYGNTIDIQNLGGVRSSTNNDI